MRTKDIRPKSLCVYHLTRSWQREVLSVHQNDPCTEIFCRGEGRKKEEEEEEKEEKESGFQKSRSNKTTTTTNKQQQQTNKQPTNNLKQSQTNSPDFLKWSIQCTIQ